MQKLPKNFYERNKTLLSISNNDGSNRREKEMQTEKKKDYLAPSFLLSLENNCSMNRKIKIEETVF